MIRDVAVTGKLTSEDGAPCLEPCQRVPPLAVGWHSSIEVCVIATNWVDKLPVAMAAKGDLFMRALLQGSAKRRSPGCVNFVAALFYHFCQALPAAFTQPGDHPSDL